MNTNNIIMQNITKAIELSQSNQPVDALALLDETLALAPNNPVVHYERGHILRQLGRFAEGLAAYNFVAEVLPDDPFVHLARSCALADLNDFENALSACDQALALNPNDPTALLHRGKLLLFLAQDQEALNTFDLLLQHDPNAVEAIVLRHRALCHLTNSLVLKKQIQFIEDDNAASRNEGSKTKFGGQPDWLADAEWPISTTTGEPMEFVAQIEIDQNHFKKATGKMAYIFMATPVDGKPMPHFWESDSGDNAVIIQPGNTKIQINTQHGMKPASPIFAENYKIGTIQQKAEISEPEFIQTQPMVTGPAYTEEKHYAITQGMEPIFNHWYDFNISNLDQDTWNACFQRVTDEYQLFGTKIGGSPYFIQDQELPNQQDCCYFLAQINLIEYCYDDGVIYVFLNEDATKGAMIYQR